LVFAALFLGGVQFYFANSIAGAAILFSGAALSLGWIIFKKGEKIK
jgi:hypothetical protein